MNSHKHPAPFDLSLLLMCSFALVAQTVGASESDSPAAVGESKEKSHIEFRLAEESPAPGLTSIKTSDYAGTLYLHAEIELTNEALKSATASEGPFGQPVVDLVLTDAGFQKLKQLASANLRKRLAIVLDGELLIAPLIAAPVTEPRVTIDGNFTVEETQRIAAALSAR